MGISYADFVVRFPEFDQASEPLVQSCLDQAGRRTPDDVWGDRADDAQAWLAAHLIALSAFGRQASLVNIDGSTSYGKQRARMESEVGPAMAPRVA